MEILTSEAHLPVETESARRSVLLSPAARLSLCPSLARDAPHPELAQELVSKEAGLGENLSVGVVAGAVLCPVQAVVAKSGCQQRCSHWPGS